MAWRKGACLGGINHPSDQGSWWFLFGSFLRGCSAPYLEDPLGGQDHKPNGCNLPLPLHAVDAVEQWGDCAEPAQAVTPQVHQVLRPCLTPHCHKSKGWHLIFHCRDQLLEATNESAVLGKRVGQHLWFRTLRAPIRRNDSFKKGQCLHPPRNGFMGRELSRKGNRNQSEFTILLL